MATVRWLLVLILLTGSGLFDSVAAEEPLCYAGATTLQKYFMPAAAKLFYSESSVRIQIEGGNTNPGLRALHKGEIDVAGSGRYLTEEEKSQGLTEHFLGWDVLAIIVHRDNPVTNLSLKDLQGIFSGAITNWKVAGGQDQPIIVVTSPKGSGMRSAVQKQILKTNSYTQQEITSAIVAHADQQVGMFTTGIAALSLSMVDDPQVKTIAVEGVKPNNTNVAEQRYALVKPLLLITKGPPEGSLDRFIELTSSTRGKAIFGKHFVPAEAP
jgi:phosphate transport system substrate-binding protein